MGACGGGGEGPPTGEPWSDPATWDDGTVPVAGEAVTIPAGRQVLLDVSPPPLAGITVEGTLVFAEKDLELTADWILVHGTLGVGTEGRPFPRQATITLTADDPSEEVETMGTRGIIVLGGTLELHGTPPGRTWARLGADAEAGATRLTLEDSVGWKAGDQVAVAPTDFYRVGHTEVFALAAADGATLTLATPLAQARWGVLQYVDDSGVTLTRTTSVSELAIDERAEVGNLTRNIVVQGAEDALWTEQGFGAHLVITEGAVGHVDGVLLRRVGQAGRLGRYPFHWHLLSYNPPGDEVGDATGQYFRRSVVSGSSQRCVVIHGTNGVTVAENVCHDIRGHAIFLEDAVERRNTLEGNLVLQVREPAADRVLLNHEVMGFRRGPSGFWLTNPDNVVRGNAVADAQGMGFWLAFPERTLGVLQGVTFHPRNLPFGVFEDNAAHSGGVSGLMFDMSPVNDQGDVSELLYLPFKDGVDTGNYDDHLPFTMSGLTSYKFDTDVGTSADGPLWNRARKGTFTGFVLADFSGTGFKGASQDCRISGNVVVGTTLNNATPPMSPAVGAASYHSQCDIAENVFVNMPAVADTPSGAFGTDDYYVVPVDKGLLRNPDNRLVNTHAGYRVPSPNMMGTENYALAGALWDPHGYWGPAGNYWVYDLPFLTAGTSCQPVTQSVHENDLSCAGPYYGVFRFGLDGRDTTEANTYRALSYTRNDNGAVWQVPAAAPGSQLGNMRHAAFVKGGSYTVRFPDATRPRTLGFVVSNVLGVGDDFLMAVEYAGNVTPIVYVTSWNNADEVPSFASWTAWKAGNPNWQSEFRGGFWHPLEPAASRDAVAASAGDRYWQDTANGLVWIKVARGGLSMHDGDPTSDLVLYGALSYVLDPDL